LHLSLSLSVCVCVCVCVCVLCRITKKILPEARLAGGSCTFLLESH